MYRAIYLSLAVVLSLSAFNMARGAMISVNFQGGGGAAALVGAQTAGYVPAGNWNDISGPTLPSFPLALQNNSGNASGVSLTVTTPNAGGTGTFPVAPMTAGDIAMLRGNIFTSNTTPVTITLSGAIPYQQYDVYVYFNGAVSNNVQTFSIYDNSLVLVQAKNALEANNTADAAFVLADGTTSGNYVRFSGLNNSTLPNFVLTAIRNPGIAYGYLNGFQIVDTTVLPAPEPTTSSLLGIGGFIMLGKVRRKVRKAQN